MKKLSLFFAGLFILVQSFNANAQTPAKDYFVGKWSVLVKGTPQGDSKMTVVLEKKEDGSLAGAIQDSTGKELSKISKVDVKDNQATVYFTTQGYDVNLEMNKKDEDHFTGSMMSMFDADGERIKTKS